MSLPQSANMKVNKKVPGPRLHARLLSLLHVVCLPFQLVLNRVFSLLVTEHWTRHTLKRIVNHEDETKRDEMAALLAGVFSSSFDWYNVDNTNWVTKSAWYSGLVLAIASVASSAIHTAAFLRIKCDAKVTERFHKALGGIKKGQGEWQPHYLMPYVLGGPTLHLKLAVLMFLIGLFYELWRAAVKASLSWQTDDLKSQHWSITPQVQSEVPTYLRSSVDLWKAFPLRVMTARAFTHQLGFHSFGNPAFAFGDSQLSDGPYASSGKGGIAVDMDSGPDLEGRGIDQPARIQSAQTLFTIARDFRACHDIAIGDQVFIQSVLDEGRGKRARPGQLRGAVLSRRHSFDCAETDVRQAIPFRAKDDIMAMFVGKQQLYGLFSATTRIAFAMESFLVLDLLGKLKTYQVKWTWFPKFVLQVYSAELCKSSSLVTDISMDGRNRRNAVGEDFRALLM
ncbi:MAG: hypothetical protein Q9184_001581 [Pyrenodesmia sp. 2 TL-2023]